MSTGELVIKVSESLIDYLTLHDGDCLGSFAFGSFCPSDSLVERKLQLKINNIYYHYQKRAVNKLTIWYVKCRWPYCIDSENRTICRYVDANRIEQCFAAHIVHSCQQ